MIDFTILNYWAVLVAFLVNMVIGAFWYSPAGFGGKTWKRFTGIDLLKMPKPEANRNIGLVALACAVQAVLTAAVVRAIGPLSVWDAIGTAVVLWVCFIAASTVGDTLYARRGKGVYLVNTGYFLVVLLINVPILALWR